MGFSLKKLVKQTINPFDGPSSPRPASTAQAVAPHMQYSPIAQQRIMARNPQGGAQQIARGVTTSVGPAIPQFNAFRALPGAAQQAGLGLGLAGVRTGAGIGQGLSGLVDLATPGKGTSQVTKSFNNLAKQADVTAKENGVEGGYKFQQVPLNIATFAIPGGVATQASKVPQAARAANVASKFASPATRGAGNIAASLTTHGAPGRIAGTTVRGITAPSNVLNAAGFTALQQGHKTANNQQVTPLGVATDLGVNLAFGGALQGGGQAVVEGGRLAARGAQAGARAITPHYNGLKPNQVIMDTNKLDVLHNAIQPTAPGNIARRQEIIDGLHQIKNDHGLDFITGTPNQRSQRIAQYLEQNGEAIPQLQAHQMRPSLFGGNPAISQGGYAQFNKPGLSRADLMNNAMYESTNLPKHLPTDPTSGGVTEALDYQTLRNKLMAAKAGIVKPLDQSGHIGVPKKVRDLAGRNLAGSSEGSIAPSTAAPSTKLVTPRQGAAIPTQRPVSTKLVSKQSEPSLPKNTPTRTEFPDEAKLNTGRLNLAPEQQKLLGEETIQVVDRLKNSEVQQIAKSAGLDTKSYTVEQTRKKIAEQLNVRQDAVRLMKEAEVARKSGDVGRTAQLIEQAAEQGRISRTQGTDLGRQLQARKIIANELDTPQHRVFKLLDEAGVNPQVYSKRLATVNFNKPKEVVAAYRELVPAKASQWLDTVRYNSMLSSPLTQAVNIFGNAQNVALVAPIEKTLRGSIDAVGGLFGKERQYAAGEGAAYAGGVARNIQKASHEFVDALKGQGKYSNPDFEEYQIPLATSGLKGATYKTLSVPMRVLDGMDKFFRALAEGGEDAALNLRQSKGFALGGNREALKEAEAAYRVFQTELGTPGQGVINGAFDEFAKLAMRGRNNKNPLVSLPAKFTIPFVKTINNIAKQGFVDYSPVGFINMKGNIDKTTALTRAIMGSAVFGTSAALLAQGQMTWAEPRNAEERARFRAEGKQPYAVKVGDKWVNFSKLTPSIGFPMALTAALHDAMESGKTDDSTKDKIIEAVAKYGNFLSDQSYAKSIGDTLGAIGGDTEAVAQAVSNNVQQVVPFRALTGWIARISDNTERKVDTSKGYIDQQVESLMAQYPGLRQKTTTRDYKGTPIAANNQIFNGFSPVKITKDRGVDPLDAEQDKFAKVQVETEGLNKQQAAEFKRKVDPEVRTAQKALLSDSDYKSSTPDEQQKKLNKVKTDITAARKAEYMAKNNIGEYADDFTGKRKSLTADQRAILHGGGGSSAQKALANSTSSSKDTYYKAADAEYKDLLKKNKTAKYNSAAQKIKADKTLAKAKVGATFAKDIRDLYNSKLSDADVYGYVTSDKNGKAIAEKLFAYGDALVAAGIEKKNKYRDKYGNITLGKSTLAKASGGGKKSAFSAALRASNNATAQNQKALLNLVKNAKVSSRGGTSKTARVAGVALKKQSVKKSIAKRKVG